MLDAPNVVHVAVVTAFVAICAIHPLNCTAGTREQGAEWSFYVGEWPGGCR